MVMKIMAATITVVLVISTPIVSGQGGNAKSSDNSHRKPTTTPTVKLAARYTDSIHGFSLCPPAGTVRIRRSSTRRLVGWILRDKTTGAIRWSLNVMQIIHTPSKLPLSQLAKQTAEALKVTNNFHVQKTRITVVAGKAAMDFQGIWKGAFQLWRRQCWILTKPQLYLIIEISGPLTDKDKMNAVFDAVLDTLDIFDPNKVIARYKKNLARGAKILDRLTDTKLQSVLMSKPLYWKVSLKGKIIGMLVLTENFTMRDKVKGILIIRKGVLKIPKQPRRLTYEEFFSSTDRTFERWKQITIDGQGKSATKSIVEGIKQNDLIAVNYQAPPKPSRLHKKRIPQSIYPSYLPQAFGVIIIRLLDLTKPAAYGFAMYDAIANDFIPRTIEVIGNETITLSAKEFRTIHLTDQMGQNEPLLNLWVDNNGLPVRMEAAGGVIIERASRRYIATRFAQELLELNKLAGGK